MSGTSTRPPGGGPGSGGPGDAGGAGAGGGGPSAGPGGVSGGVSGAGSGGGPGGGAGAGSGGPSAGPGAGPSAAAPADIDGILHAGRLAGISPSALAEEFGTPFYVYDLDLIGRRVDALKATLPRGFRVAFAVKANPSLAVVAHLRRCGVGADVASGGELDTVLRAGFEPEKIAMTGPGKRDEELTAAVAAGIGFITVESPGELRRLETIAAAAGKRQPILLRLAVAEDAHLETVRIISGVEGKFGMPLHQLTEAARVAAASEHVDLLGIHAFGASNVRDAEQLVAHVADLVEIGRRVAAETGTTLRLVDAGGGLGIPYSDGERPLDLDRLCRRLAELRARWDADTSLRNMEIVLEPGRFLVGPAGAYVARVVDVKGHDSGPVAILDGGINHVLRPALLGGEQRLAVLASDGLRAMVHATVAGPLCTGLDVFTTGAMLPRPRVGDLIAVLDAGAYGFTESMPFFLSHPTAVEVAVKGGRAQLIRPRMFPAELLDRQTNPDW
jgi:diaminopimelate decarboxylase